MGQNPNNTALIRAIVRNKEDNVGKVLLGPPCMGVQVVHCANSRELSSAQLLQLCLTALLSTVSEKRSLRHKSELSIPGKHQPQAENRMIENSLWSFFSPGSQTTLRLTLQ